ncbi:MAG TPA: DUF1731 domain-containing protein, partial [Microbacterium sp.]|uniref:DUF1731 domain-containing protein n=1 Tax=Microbacterium sp. TaxID=51671 RepID=UPI002BF113B3
ASPNHSDNRTLMRVIREIVRMPVGLSARRWMLEPAMWALRTEPELILKSRWVLPGILTDAGFTFSRPDLEQALRRIAAGAHRPPPHAAHAVPDAVTRGP